MANTGKSSLTLVGRVCRMLTLSVFLGFGLSYCSGDSGSDEAVQVSESNESAEAAPDATSDGAPAAEAAAAPENADQPVVALDEGNPPPAVEDAAPSAEVAETGPVVDEATPLPAPEAVEASTETVNAELPEAPVERAQEAVAATAPQAPMDSTPPGFDAKPTQDVSAPVGDGSSVSSPGSAKYVASADGAHHKGHKHHTHHKAAAAAPAEDGAAASSGAAPAIANASEYIIESGDSLALISKKIFGNIHQWHTLAQQNAINPPYKIFPGDALRFDASDPKAAEFVKGYKTTMKTLTVKQGDSLSKLAKEVYADAGAWKRLLSFNRDKISNPNHLEVGMTLAYMEDAAHAKPADAAAAPAAKKAAAPKAHAKKTQKKSAGTTKDAE